MKKTTFLFSVILICLLQSCKTPELVCDEKYIPEYKTTTNKVTVMSTDLPDVNWKFYYTEWISDNQIAYVKYPDELKKYISMSSKSKFESSPDAIIVSLDNGETLDINPEHQSIFRETYNDLFHVEPKKESVGTSIAKGVGVFLSAAALLSGGGGGGVGPQSAEYLGWKSDIQSENKILYSIHTYVKDKGKYTEAVVTKLTLKNEEMGFKNKFDISELNPVSKYDIYNSAILSRSMQISPDGRFVQLGNLILDIKTGEKIVLSNYKGLISNDWRKIAFFSANSEIKGAFDITTTKFVMP